MDSLSGKQVKELKELYNSMYKVEQPAGESISEVNFEEYFESLSEEKKKNFFQRVFTKFMQGPDYGNKRKKEEEKKKEEESKKIDKQVDDYVEKNKGEKPINKVKVDDETSGSAVLTKKNDTKSNNSNSDANKNKNEIVVNGEKIKTTNDNNSAFFNISANNPENFKNRDAQKEYLKLLSNKDVNPAEIDGSKYFKSKDEKTNKTDTKVKVDTEIKKNEVKKKEKPLLSTKLPDTTKLGSTVKPVKPGSARDKMIAKNELRHGADHISNLRNQNADFKRYKSGEITKMDFMKQYPKSQTTKKYNMRQIELGKPTIKSQYEPYDLVLDYVLSEGHADTVEEAHYVMTQMDAETIQTIIKEKKTL